MKIKTYAIFWLGVLSIAAGCEGGGCSSGGCGDPIPDGFPLDKRVENGAQMRLTSHGLDFLRENYTALLDLFGPEGLVIDIPPSSQDVLLVGRVDFCPSGGCSANVLVQNVEIATNPPDAIKITMQAQIWTASIPFTINQGLACICLEDCMCDLALDTRTADPPTNSFSASLVFSIDPVTAYTRVEVARAAIEDVIQGEDMAITNLNLCGWGVCNLLDLGFIKDFVVGQVAGQLAGTIEEASRSMFCLKCGETGCPLGSSCEGETPDDVCVYPDGECVPVRLGIESRVDVASAAGLPLPDPPSPVDMLLAAGGYAVVDNGLNLGFMAGAEPALATPCASRLGPPPGLGPVPLSTLLWQDEFAPCAPCAPEDAPCPGGYLCLGGICVTAHYQLDEEGQAAGCRGHTDCSMEGSGFRCIKGKCTYVGGECIRGGSEAVMVSAGLGETAVARMLYGVFASGLPCAKLSTPQIPQLTTTTLGMIIPALQGLAWQDAPVRLSMLPSSSPSIALRDWPLITLYMNGFTIDFYAWIHNAYVRILSTTCDLEAAADLSAQEGKITPELVYIAVGNVEVETGGMIVTPQEEIAGLLASLINTLLPMLLGTASLDPIELPALTGGIEAVLPDGGIGRVQEGEEDFIGLFMNLAVTEPPPPPPPEAAELHVDTAARVSSSRIVASGSGEDAAPIPELEIAVAARDGSGPLGEDDVEVRFRIDGMLWSSWTGASTLKICDPIFLLDGAHEVSVKARRRGRPATEDPSPAVLALHIDTHPPLIRLIDGDGAAPRIEAIDAVTPPGRLELRCRFVPGTGTWTSCPTGSILRPPRGTEAVEVEARDEAGNRGTGTFEIRGRVPPVEDASSGCGCTAAGGGRGGGAALVLIALLAVFAMIGRRKGAGVACLALILLTAAGGCTFDASYHPMGCRSSEDCSPGQACCAASGRCMEPPARERICDPGWSCQGEIEFDPSTCSFTQSCCVENPPLERGRAGTYLSFAAAADGSVWVTGYNEGASAAQLYGDLIAGRWNDSPGEVAWATIDGIPARGRIEGSPSGWRGGIVTPGEDVGLWTSSVAMPDGAVVMFYYDRTGGRLKAAMADAAGSCRVLGVVDDNGDAGLYTSAVPLPDPGGGVGVAYRAVYESPAAEGEIMTEVRYAYSSDPASGSFSVETALSSAAPCWKEICGSGRICRGDNGLCAAAESDAGCNGGDGCEASQACVSGECVPVVSWISDVPRGIGVCSSLAAAPDGTIDLLYYDATAGDLVLLRRDAFGWQPPQILDGDELDPERAGDKGWAPSVTVDAAGGVHAAYMDARAEILLYQDVSVGVVDVVDDGIAPSGEMQRVGESSSIAVDGSGIVRVTYMNASTGRLMMAARSGPFLWIRTDISPGPGAYGFYAKHKTLGDRSIVATFFVESGGAGLVEDVRILDCTLDSGLAALCH